MHMTRNFAEDYGLLTKTVIIMEFDVLSSHSYGVRHGRSDLGLWFGLIWSSKPDKGMTVKPSDPMKKLLGIDDKK